MNVTRAKSLVLSVLGMLLMLHGAVDSADAAVRLPKIPKPTPKPSVSTNVVLEPTLPTDYVFRTIARIDSVPLVAGKQYRAFGGWTSTANGVGSLMGARVEMVPVGSVDLTQRKRAALSTTNHKGVAGVTSVIDSDGLFTVPVPVGGVAGDLVSYKVELRGQAGRCQIEAGSGKMPKTYYATPLNGLCVTTPQHSLNVTSASLEIDLTQRAGGLEWRQPADTHFGGPAPRPVAVDVLVKAHELPAGTTSVQAYTGTELSVESTGGTAPLRAKLTQQVRQLNPAGGYCKITSSSTVVDIDGTLHHLKVHQYASVPVDPSCGTGPGGGPRFSTKMYVQYVAALPGDPVRHGGVVHAEPYSSGYIYGN